MNQTCIPLRLVGYTVEGKTYFIATSRFDLTAEQIAQIYKLRWQIESFCAWWKRHLKVSITLSPEAATDHVQIVSGLITYLLIWLTVSMEIYCPLILSFCSQERGRFYDGRSC